MIFDALSRSFLESHLHVSDCAIFCLAEAPASVEIGIRRHLLENDPSIEVRIDPGLSKLEAGKRTLPDIVIASGEARLHSRRCLEYEVCEEYRM